MHTMVVSGRKGVGVIQVGLLKNRMRVYCKNLAFIAYYIFFGASVWK